MTLEEFEKVEKDVLDGKVEGQEHKSMDWLISGLSEHYAEKELQGMIEEIHQEERQLLQNDRSTKTSIIKLLNSSWTMRIAAAILIIFVPMFLLLGPRGDSDIYSEYYSTYPNLMTTRSSESDAAIQKAGKAYSDGDFERVLAELALVENEQASFYTAISLMELERYEEALSKWEAHLLEYTYLTHVSKFHQALVYIKLNRHTEAISLLKELSVQQGHVGSKSKKLLEAIN